MTVISCGALPIVRTRMISAEADAARPWRDSTAMLARENQVTAGLLNAPRPRTFLREAQAGV